ncbi:hypothetical protein D3C75_1239000 [compost metagenome]
MPERMNIMIKSIELFSRSFYTDVGFTCSESGREERLTASRAFILITKAVLLVK